MPNSERMTAPIPSAGEINTTHPARLIYSPGNLAVYCGRWHKLLGFSGGELGHDPYQGWLDRFHPDDRPTARRIEAYLQDPAQHSPLMLSYRLMNRQGEWLVLQSTIAKHTLDNGGEEWAISLVPLDLKPREDVAESEDGAIGEVPKDQLFWIGKEMTLHELGREGQQWLQQMLGIALKDGESLKDALAQAVSRGQKVPVFIHQFLELVQRSLKGETVFHQMERKEGGQPRMMELFMTPRYHNGQLGGVRLQAQTLTEQQGRNTAQRYKRELRATILELNAILYQLSHHLKGPISSLRGLLDLVGQEDASAGQQSYLDLMGTCVDKMEKTVTDLAMLEKVRLEEPNYEPLDMGELVNEVKDRLKGLTRPNGIHINYVSKGSDSFTTVRPLMEILLSVLLENACQFSREVDNPYVNVVFEKEGDRAIVRVEDNGQGIDDGIKHKVFDMFYRGNFKSTGAGVGLYIAKSIVDKLHGSIRIDSDGRSYLKLRLSFPLR